MITIEQSSYNKSGFTIVELLIVIVVIGILAAISIVAYSGVQQRATIASLVSDLDNASKRLKLDQIDNGTYPATVSLADGGNGLKSSTSTSYQYSVNNASPQTFCLTATSGATSYFINQSGSPSAGGCAGHGVGTVAAVTNLVTNPSYETNVTGFNANGTNTIASSTDFALNGNRSMKIVASGTTNVGAYTSIPLSSGITYTFSGYVYLPLVFGSGLRLCAWGAPINGGTIMCTGYVSTTGSWQRLTLTAAATSSGNVNFYFYNAGPSTAPIGNSAYIDGLMVTAEGSASGFGDGNSPNWVWNGTVNNSTSTGLPL